MRGGEGHKCTHPSKIVLRWAFWLLFFSKNREKSKPFARFFAIFSAVHLRVTSKKHFFLTYHHLLWTLYLDTHMPEISNAGRIFSPSPYLHFGSGLRSISLFYVELRLFEKQATFSVLVMSKIHWKAGFAVHSNRSNSTYRWARGARVVPLERIFSALQTEHNFIFIPL